MRNAFCRGVDLGTTKKTREIRQNLICWVNWFNKFSFQTNKQQRCIKRAKTGFAKESCYSVTHSRFTYFLISILKHLQLNDKSLIGGFNVQYRGIFLLVSYIVTRTTCSPKYGSCPTILHTKPSNKIYLFINYNFIRSPTETDIILVSSSLKTEEDTI